MYNKTTDGRGFEAQEISWMDGCSLLQSSNPELVKIIKQIKPSDEHTFLKVSYPFGSPIIYQGSAYLPASDRGKSISFNDETLPKEFITQDGYGITEACRNYLSPLIAGEAYPPYENGLPQYVQYSHECVKKKL